LKSALKENTFRAVISEGDMETVRSQCKDVGRLTVILRLSAVSLMVAVQLVNQAVSTDVFGGVRAQVRRHSRSFDCRLSNLPVHVH
jgi:hypothetical protein